MGKLHYIECFWFFVIQNKSYTLISFEGGDFVPYFRQFPEFLERKRQLWSSFSVSQILKPRVGPAFHIFLQVS